VFALFKQSSMPLTGKCGNGRLGFLANDGMSYSGMEYLPDEISLDKREPTSRT
jgi:hypothetical protein